MSSTELPKWMRGPEAIDRSRKPFGVYGAVDTEACEGLGSGERAIVEDTTGRLTLEEDPLVLYSEELAKVCNSD